MTISEVIKALENLKAQYGDLRVTIYDDYTANEGWGYRHEELWLDVDPFVFEVKNDDGKVVETVVQF
jgi:hypothetical protein